MKLTRLTRHQTQAKNISRTKVGRRVITGSMSLRIESGASLAEFLVAAPLVLLVGMAALQTALIYHAKVTLNYATFEAARTGAVNNARIDVMRKELGIRLAPIKGGDGSTEQAGIAIAQSVLDTASPITTKLQVLNPMPAAFEDWGINREAADDRVIPNSHLRHASEEVGEKSGVSLRDANLLKLRVVHGMTLKVPVVGSLFVSAMSQFDPDNATIYRLGKFPIKSVATVRMQSESWEKEILAANETLQVPPGDGREPSDPHANSDGGQITDGGDSNLDLENLQDSECEGSEYGLAGLDELIDTSTYARDQCLVANPAMSLPIAENPIDGPDGENC